MGFVEGKTSFL